MRRAAGREGAALRSWPLSIVTLKDRTQSPAVERFMDCAREAAKWIADLEK